MAEIVVTKDNFKEVVVDATKPVLLDFWATWCGPCQMLSPIIAEIAQEHDGEIVVGKINVDEESKLAHAFNVESIPLLVVVRNGNIAKTAVGYRSKEEVLELLK